MNQAVEILCPAGLVSGKEVVSLTLATGLRERGWDARFIVSSWNDGEFLRQLDARNFRHDALPLGFISLSLAPEIAGMTWGQMRRWPELARGYRRIRESARPQAVIHTNWHHALLLLPWLNPERDIYWAHEFVPITARYKLLFRALSTRVAGVVCISKAVARNFLALGIRKEKIIVVHNGVAADRAPRQSRREAPFRIGIVGQITAWKGHEDLLEAIALLVKQDVGCEMSIFGSGAPGYIDELKDQAARLGILDLVRWRGFNPAQADIYGHIDVCVAPSREPEPLGMSALEAGAFGLPVVCTGQGGLPEIVEDGRSGIVVTPRAPLQLAEALARLARDPALSAKMGEAGRRRARDEFSQEKFIDRFAKIIERPDAPA